MTIHVHTMTVGDSLTSLGAQLVQDGTAVNLTGLTVKFLMIDVDGDTVIPESSTNVLVVDAENGIVEYDWQPEDVMVAGRYYAWFVVYGLNDERDTFPTDGRTFIIDMEDPTSIDEEEPSSGSVTTPGASMHDGCPVLGKTRFVVVSQGQQLFVDWDVRDRDGSAVDLSGYLNCITLEGSSSSSSSSSTEEICADGHVSVRFQEALGIYPTVYELTATVPDAANGIIRFQLPATIVNEAGIWRMEIGVYNTGNILSLTEMGYVSVERGLFGTSTPSGPLTLQEVRMQLRDTMLENDLLDDVEFDDVEIIYAILQPVREWNEKPPPVAFYTAGTFPYHFHWLQAVTANLLMTAAHWYERNNLGASHGGITVNDRDKSNPYLAVAKLLRSQWLEFIINKKISINAGLFYGTVGSLYD